MADIFQEINEDLRRERLIGFWRRYAVALIVVVVGIAVGAAAYVFWQNHRQAGLERDAVALAAAAKLAADGKPADAAQAYVKLGGDASSPTYALLAKLDAAALKADAGDAAGAAALYDQVATSGGDETLVSLARLVAVQVLFDSADAGELDRRLTVIGEPVWSPLVRELKALVRLKAGDTAAARQQFQALSEDPGVPDGVRRRAVDLLAGLGGPLPPAEPAAPPTQTPAPSAPPSEPPKS